MLLLVCNTVAIIILGNEYFRVTNANHNKAVKSDSTKNLTELFCALKSSVFY